jgi:uncharacterized membrane protein
MPWIFLALISITTLSVASILARVLLKEENSNPVGYAIVFQLLLGLISLIFALLFNKLIPPPPETSAIQFLFSAVLWATSTIFSFKALKLITAGEATILGSSGAFISITLGIIFLGEALKISTIASAILIFIAILAISTGKLSFSSKRGIVYSLISASVAAVAVVNDTAILKTYEAFSFTALMCLLPGFILLLSFPKESIKIPKMFDRKTLTLMTVFCTLYSIQAITFYLALQNGAPISQLSPLSRASIVLTVILGVIFLKEKSNLGKKFIAAIMVTIGAILLG